MVSIESLRSRYELLNGPRPADGEYIRRIAKELGVVLPQPYLQIAQFFDGSGFAVLPLHAMSLVPATNVLSETLRLRRSIGLPEQFLVLGEPSESLLVMDCRGSGEVIWCDAIDAPRLGKEQLLKVPETWESFDAFFSYLMDEEEQDRT